MARSRTTAPQSTIIKTAEEIRAEIEAMAGDEKAKALASLEDDERAKAERQAKYDKERI